MVAVIQCLHRSSTVGARFKLSYSESRTCQVCFCSFGSKKDLMKGDYLLDLQLRHFLVKIDDNHWDRILIAEHCFHVGYVRKQPMAWNKYYAESCNAVKAWTGAPAAAK